MNYSFREIFKRVKLKYILLILLILIIFNFLFQYLISSSLILTAEFPLDKSQNPQASKHFIKAMEYKNYTKMLHDFVDYDSFLMRPLLNKIDEEYEKGKAILPKNSAEDVYWFVALYRSIYGIGSYPNDMDMSMSYEKNLAVYEYQKHYEDILSKIKRFAVDDFSFDIPIINSHKYEFMVNLIDELRYTINEYTKEDKKTFLDKKYLEDFIEIYGYYNNFSKKYLPISNNQNENNVNDIYTKTRFSAYILTFKINQSENANCDDSEYKNLFENLKTLKQMSLDPKYQSQNFYYNGIFKEGIWIYEVLDIAQKACPKIKDESMTLLGYFDPQLKAREEAIKLE